MIHNFVSILLIILSIETILASDEENVKASIPNKEFYDACAFGKLDLVQQYVTVDPSLVTASTMDGESCLHLSAISKSVEVAKYMIESGADVNLRVTHDKGLRMTPLSWHVWGGNAEIIELLLDSGANVNDDFDFSPEKDVKVTALDVASIFIKDLDNNESEDDNKFLKTFNLLKERGGKLYADLYPESPHILSFEKSDAREDNEEFYEL